MSALTLWDFQGALVEDGEGPWKPVPEVWRRLHEMPGHHMLVSERPMFETLEWLGRLPHEYPGKRKLVDVIEVRPGMQQGSVADQVVLHVKRLSAFYRQITYVTASPDRGDLVQAHLPPVTIVQASTLRGTVGGDAPNPLPEDAACPLTSNSKTSSPVA